MNIYLDHAWMSMNLSLIIVRFCRRSALETAGLVSSALHCPAASSQSTHPLPPLIQSQQPLPVLAVVATSSAAVQPSPLEVAPTSAAKSPSLALPRLATLALLVVISSISSLGTWEKCCQMAAFVLSAELAWQKTRLRTQSKQHPKL